MNLYISNTNSLIESLEKRVKQLESLINFLKNKGIKFRNNIIWFKKSNKKDDSSSENNNSEKDKNFNNFKNTIREDNNNEEQINNRDIDIKSFNNENTLYIKTPLFILT